VPSYLNKFKEQAEDKKRQKVQDLEDAQVPPGCRLLPESERLSMLEDLKESKAEVNKELDRMPLAQTNMRIEKHKAELI